MTGNELTTTLKKFLVRKISPKILALIDDAELIELYNVVARDFVLSANLLNDKYSQVFSGINIELKPEITAVQSFLHVGGAFTQQEWAIAEDHIIVLKLEVSNIPIQIFYSRLPSPLQDLDDEIDVPIKYNKELIELVKAKVLYDFADGNIADYETLLQRYTDDVRRSDSLYGLGKPRKYWMGLPGDDSYYEIVDKKVTRENIIRDVNDGLWKFINPII